MNLDLSKLISGVQNELTFEFEHEPNKSYMESIGSVDKSVFKVVGKVKRLEKRFELTFSYTGDVTFECYRCLKNVKMTLENDVERIVVQSLAHASDDDWVELSGPTLELVPILEEDITLNLPLQVLCTEDCKGLCPTCGIDLNKETCECDESKIDPRLEALKQLFTQIKEVLRYGST